MTRVLLAAACSLALLMPPAAAAAGPGRAAGQPPASGPHFDLQAHRGGLGLVTENTLEAFANAMRLGVTTLELDVQITEDGEAVVTHDRRVSAAKCRDTVPAVTGDPEFPYVGDYIRNLTLAQVWTLDCGQLLADHPGQQVVPGARMPLLSEVFALVTCFRANQVWLNVETKVEAGAPEETAPREQFVQVVAREVRDAGLLDRVTIQSFDWGALMRMREVEPRLPIIALTNGDFLQVGRPGASPWLGGIDIDDFGGSLVAAAASFGADAISPVHGTPQNGKVTDPGYQPYTTPALVAEAHRAGLAVIPWTIDDTTTMASLMDAGVDGIITNYPDRLRALMAERGLKLPRPAREPRGRDCLAAAQDARVPEPPQLPLGAPGLAERRTAQVLAPGVLHTRIVRGTASPRDAWVVDVGFLGTRAAARELRRELVRDGFAARIERVRGRAQDDPARGPLGFLVRSGRFTTEAQAVALRERFVAAGRPAPRVVFTGEDGGPTSGPWVVNVLEVDPARYGGTVDAVLATDVVPGRETLSALAARRGALAAINGGYFVIGAANGTDGDLAGSSVLAGVPVSEAVDGRTSLVLPDASGAGARISALSDRLTITAPGGASRELDGLNREPGLIRGCGGSGGDLPTERPKHDFTCTDAGELIRYAPVFGPATPGGPGAEAVLDAAGTVLELRQARGGAIPAGGSVLSGTGDAATWLRLHARPGARLDLTTQLRTEDGPLTPGPQTAVVNGGPRLLRGGQVDIPAYAEGFHWPENPEFLYRFGVRRNPRTLAGVTADGRLLLVTVDGRQPGHSVGASFAESAAIMQALGAVDAVNLDGGGSTAMTVGSSLVTRPSDTTGERPIADALVLTGG